MKGPNAMNTQEIVRAFYASVESKDFKALRGMLHDDLDFQGPMDRSGNADTFVAKLAKLSSLMESLRMKHLFVDGDRACCVYDLVTATPVGDSPVAEYLEVRDGRIACIRAHHDSRPWAALFPKGAA